jgi:hypothetical protein
VLVPWGFVACLSALYVGMLVPRVVTVHWFAVVWGCSPLWS